MRSAPKRAAGIAAMTVARDDPKFLQDFLARRLSLSRRAAKAMVDGRNVWVSRRCVWIARYALKTGDVVEVPNAVVRGAQRQGGASHSPFPVPHSPFPVPHSPFPVPRSPFPVPHSPTTRRHVRVLWSDDSYLVCDKPAGIVSCDDERSAEAILRVQEGVPTLVAVHRLDRDTTGCLLFAKSHAAFLAAVETFKTHKVSKTYHAIVAGRFRFAHQAIDTPLDGQPAVTRVTREGATDDASFLRLRIETGRTNQIRRHLASVRFPVLGDRVFGLKRARDPRLMQVPRQMLHASTLALPHPLDRRAEISVHSPLPADFRSALRLFGL